jgi:hypothetical protein
MSWQRIQLVLMWVCRSLQLVNGDWRVEFVLVFVLVGIEEQKKVRETLYLRT